MRLCGKIMRHCFNRFYSCLVKEDEEFPFRSVPFRSIPFHAISSFHSGILKFANSLEERDSCCDTAALPVAGNIAFDPHG